MTLIHLENRAAIGRTNSKLILLISCCTNINMFFYTLTTQYFVKSSSKLTFALVFIKQRSATVVEICESFTPPHRIPSTTHLLIVHCLHNNTNTKTTGGHSQVGNHKNIVTKTPGNID